MKKVVRLTESELKHLIRESINEIRVDYDGTARRDLRRALLPNIQYNNYKGTATFNGGIGPFKNGEKLRVTIDKENDWFGTPMISIHPIVNGRVDKKRGIQFFSSTTCSSAKPSELYMIGDASDDGWVSSSYRPCSISDACRYLPTNIAKEFVEASRQYVEHMTSDDDDIVNNFTYQDWVDAIGQNMRDYESDKSNNSLDDNIALRKWYDAKKSMNKNNKLGESTRRTIRKCMKKTIRLTESELKHVIMESVKRVLSEGVVDELENLEQKLCDIASDMKEIYFDNERYFDKVPRFDRMGLDNPPYSCGTQGELSMSYDAEKWQEFTDGHGIPFEKELQDTFKWFNTIKYYAECEGYGIGAASRGFDVTRPIGLLWSKSVEAIRVLKKMAEITNTKINEEDMY